MAKVFKSFLISGAGVLMISCAGNSSNAQDDLIPTVYYKPIISEASSCDKEEVQSIKTNDDNELVKICHSDYKKCLTQGSCLVVKGKKAISINYAGRKAGVYRFTKVDTSKCPFGFGLRSSCLDPYYTIAADPKYHKFGDVIYVPAVVGTVLPNGQIHDGYFIVRDSGGGIVGQRRFDFYIGFAKYFSDENPFKSLKLHDPDTRTRFQKITGTLADQVRASRNFPSLNIEVLAEGVETVSANGETGDVEESK